MGGWGGGVYMGEGDHRPPSPVICKSHELSCSKARSSQITPAIRV